MMRASSASFAVRLSSQVHELPAFHPLLPGLRLRFPRPFPQHRFCEVRNRIAEVLARCGHWTPIEKPAECEDLLKRFYAQRM